MTYDNSSWCSFDNRKIKYIHAPDLLEVTYTRSDNYIMAGRPFIGDSLIEIYCPKLMDGFNLSKCVNLKKITINDPVFVILPKCDFEIIHK